MLLIVSPHSFVSISIGPSFNSFSFHFSIHKFSFVSGIVVPKHYTIAYYVIFMKFSLINLARIGKVIFALTFKLSIDEITFVIVSIEFKPSFSSFLRFNKGSFVFNGVVIPSFYSVSMILVVQPLASIHWTFSVYIYAESVGFSIFPFALIYVTIWVGHSTFPIEKAVFGLALVLATVSKSNGAKTFVNWFVSVFCPLALILFLFINFDEEIVPY